jgi:hypothetical protein
VCAGDIVFAAKGELIDCCIVISNKKLNTVEVLARIYGCKVIMLPA